jgi:hypothetical protein
MHVYAIEFASPGERTPHLFDVDIEKQSASKIDIGSQIENKPIVALATSASGDLLVSTAESAWSCNIDKKSCTRLCTAPKGLQFKDMACNPENNVILLSTRDGEMFHEKPDSDHRRGAFVLERVLGNLFPVEMRRVDYIDGIVFSSQGDLFFGSGGDLWQGSVGSVGVIEKNLEAKKHVKSTGEPSSHDERSQFASLAARRCAALATLETYRGSPVQIGVQKIAPANGMVSVHLLRMYGFGTGVIASLPTPPRWPAADEETDGLDERVNLYVKEASSLQVIGYCEDYSYLCASSDGNRVFFRGALDPDTRKSAYGFYLVENNGKPRGLKLKFME